MLTAQEIQAQQFHVRFRGFDVEEVDEFLEQTAAAVQKLTEENTTLKAKLEAAERKVAAYKRQEKNSMEAIIAAQKISDEMKTKARREAEELLGKAREEAKGLEESAGREISELERELDRLRAMKEQAREEVRRVLQGYLSSLESDSVPAGPAGGTVAGSRSAAGSSLSAAGAEDAEARSQAAPVDQGAKSAGGGLAAAAAGVAAMGATAGQDDDLYQRIELDDDLLPKNPEASPATLARDQQADNDEPVLPDLDGDMVFTLEDPLDEEPEEAATDGGPNISLDDEDGEDEEDEEDAPAKP